MKKTASTLTKQEADRITQLLIHGGIECHYTRTKEGSSRFIIVVTGPKEYVSGGELVIFSTPGQVERWLGFKL